MRHLIPLLILTGCASEPLTEEEQFQREYEEADRKVQYQRWEKDCLTSGGIIYADNPARICRKKGCVPNRRDWRWDDKRERPAIGNSVRCLTQSQINDLMGSIFR